MTGQVLDLVRERGPLTVAAFMDLALNHPEAGYYAGAAQRSGRAGDFFTSVDVGPLFGDLLAVQLAEMAGVLDQASAVSQQPSAFDLVEAGAGNGRLSADILRAAKRRDPAFYERIRLHLVETSAAAREHQRETLGETAGRLVSSSDALPASFAGALVANELLDALPVHQVVMREDGLREVYVAVEDRPRGREAADCSNGALVAREGPPSTPELACYLDRLGVTLEPGWRVEIGIRAIEWVREAARALRRGFLVLIDYGHEARDLYSASHSAGTLTTCSRHTMAGPESAPLWLQRPGRQDITAHVDFTSVRAAAEAEGLETLGFLDQTYLLLGILGSNPASLANPRDRLALKTLIMPGGLGSTHKVLLCGKGVGRPALAGCSFRVRAT